MKRIVLCLALALTTPAMADTNSAPADTEEGLSLIERGAQMLLRGLIDDIEPAMEDFRALAEGFGPKMQELMLEMGPALEALADKIDDIRNYDAPEILPNGDIIIRRKPEAPAYEGPPGVEL